MTTHNPGDTTRSGIACPLRMRAAIGGLPSASEAMRDELERWMEMVTPTEDGAPTADVRYGASIDAAMVMTAWRISADAQRMRPGLDAYFADYGAEDQEGARLDATLALLGPQRAGIWIKMANDALETGWFLDEPLDVTKAFSVAGADSSRGKQAALAWLERYGITRATHLARFVGTPKPYCDLFVDVPDVDAALDLLRSLEMAEPNGLVDDGLRHTSATAVSIRLTDEGVVRIGILGRRPRTSAVLSLLRAAVDDRDPVLLAAFEGTLGVAGPTWVEFDRYAFRANLELHYDLD